jgi:hypothetical protein
MCGNRCRSRVHAPFTLIPAPALRLYRCQVAGSYFGINSDSPTDLNETSVFDLFEDAGVSYKAYQEAYPGRAASGAQYVVPERCRVCLPSLCLCAPAFLSAQDFAW